MKSTEWTVGKVIDQHRTRLELTMNELAVQCKFIDSEGREKTLHPNHIWQIVKKNPLQSFHVSRLFAIIRGLQHFDPNLDLMTFFPEDIKPQKHS